MGISYIDQIKSVILDIGERQGSSLPAIKKKLDCDESKYRFVRVALKKGLNDGIFVQNKGKYKVAIAHKQTEAKKKSMAKKSTATKKKSNATKKAPKKSNTTIDKIQDLILKLGERSGSSLQAIKKGLGWDASKHRYVRAALKKGLEEGIFVQNKGKYKIAAAHKPGNAKKKSTSTMQTKKKTTATKKSTTTKKSPKKKTTKKVTPKKKSTTKKSPKKDASDAKRKKSPSSSSKKTSPEKKAKTSPK